MPTNEGMSIKYTKIALKTLQGYDRPTCNRIRTAIKGLTEEPPKGDIKTLVGADGELRLRVGKYRIKFKYIITKELIKALWIIDIDSRGNIYK